MQQERPWKPEASWAPFSQSVTPNAKKTGFLSQGVTEKPGECSESVQLRLTRNIRLQSYKTRTEIYSGPSKNDHHAPSKSGTRKTKANTPFHDDLVKRSVDSLDSLSSASAFCDTRLRLRRAVDSRSGQFFRRLVPAHG